MGAVEQRTVEGTTRCLSVAYKRAEELVADHLRWFREGRLPPVPGHADRLELELVVAGGPTLWIRAERAPDGTWRLHPDGDTERLAFEEAIHALAVRTFGRLGAERLESLALARTMGAPAARTVSEVGRRRPR